MQRGLGVALGVLAAALVGCHGPLDVRNEAAGDPNAPPWVRDPRLAERTSAAADTAARVWGGTPGDLDGWTVVYVPHAIDGDLLGKASEAFLFGGGTIDVDVFSGPACLEATSLAHEIGHVVIGDGDHRDTRWHTAAFDARMRSALSDLVPSSDHDCRASLASANIL